MNLFSNLNHGIGSRPFQSGGEGQQGPHSGPYSTYYNNRGKLGLRMPDASGDWFHGTLVTMVGLRTDALLANDNEWSWVLEKPPQVCGCSAAGQSSEGVYLAGCLHLPSGRP